MHACLCVCVYVCVFMCIYERGRYREIHEHMHTHKSETTCERESSLLLPYRFQRQNTGLKTWWQVPYSLIKVLFNPNLNNVYNISLLNELEFGSQYP